MLTEFQIAYYVHTAATFCAGLGLGVLATIGVMAYLKWTQPDSTRPTLILPPE